MPTSNCIYSTHTHTDFWWLNNNKYSTGDKLWMLFPSFFLLCHSLSSSFTQTIGRFKMFHLNNEIDLFRKTLAYIQYDRRRCNDKYLWAYTFELFCFCSIDRTWSWCDWCSITIKKDLYFDRCLSVNFS